MTTEDKPTTGAGAIQLERARQFGEEEYTAANDRKWTAGELLAAAKAYIDVNERLDVEIPNRITALQTATAGLPVGAAKDVAVLKRSLEQNPLEYVTAPAGWPWDQVDFKPSLDRKRNLEKAGALIAAEWDRIKRTESA